MTKNKTLTLDEIIPACINPNCDGNGSIPEEVGEDDWVQAQCEYCFTVRFPMKQAILQWVADEVVGKNRLPAFKNGVIIGEDKPFSSNMADSAVFGSGYNTAKGEQRQILKDHGWKGDGQ